MRTLGGFAIALLLSTGLFAQNHGNQSGFVNTGAITRGFPSVVHPGSSSAMPGVQRTAGSVVNPGGGGPQIGIPGLRPPQPAGVAPARHRNTGTVTTFSYPYPVYVGGYGNGYGNGYYDQPAVQQQAPGQQPNVIVVYPPAPAYPAYPLAQGPVQSNMVEVPQTQAPEEQPSGTQPIHYLIALKDHSIYSAIAYWVDGDTLHYFTSGNTHNQVAVSKVDRDLTKRLNEDSGLELKLPQLQ